MRVERVRLVPAMLLCKVRLESGWVRPEFGTSKVLDLERYGAPDFGLAPRPSKTLSRLERQSMRVCRFRVAFNVFLSLLLILALSLLRV